MKTRLIIIHDEVADGFDMLAGGAFEAIRHFDESSLRSYLGTLFQGTEGVPTKIINEARAVGLATTEVDLKGFTMKRRPSNTKFRGASEKVNELIRSVVRGGDPTSIVEKLVELQPDDVYVKAFMEGDDVIFTDATDTVIPPGANSALDAIRGMVDKCRTIAVETNRECRIIQIVDGYEGMVQTLYTQAQQEFGRMNSTSYADYPQMDDFQRRSF